MIQIEICAPSLASAEAARKGGATRVELCRDLRCGGLTPSERDIYECVQTLGLQTRVLIRPRPGNFCYTAEEWAEIEASIALCRRAGAAAVVVGFLDKEGRIDRQSTRRAVELADGMEVTFHRAFDEAQQPPLEALQAVADCGCSKLLTSGQAPSAPEGIATLRSLVGQTAVSVVAGSGITPANARHVVQATGVAEIHASCKNAAYQTSADLVASLLAAMEGL